MICSKDRINTCITKYGLSMEEATRIVKETDEVLSVEELRMKYDNPYLGISYPDWLTVTEHLKMCYKTAGEAYNANWSTFCTVEDLASMLFIKSSIKLNTFKNHKHLKAALVTTCINIYRDNIYRVQTTFSYSLEGVVNEYNNSNPNTYNKYSSLFKNKLGGNAIEKSTECCISDILSIKDRTVREILIVCGYIIANIIELESYFYDIIYNSDLINKEQLARLLDTIAENDKLYQQRFDNKDNKKENTLNCTKRKKTINFYSILNIFNLNKSNLRMKNYIIDYLQVIGFIN